MTEKKSLLATPRLLLAAVLASLTASVCCIGPFLLLATGLGGAWMSRVMLLEPLQPVLTLLSLSLVGYAGWRLLNERSCVQVSETVAQTSPDRIKLTAFVLTLILVLILISSEYWIPVIAG